MAKIEKIMYTYLAEDAYISVYLSNISDPKMVDLPETSIKSIADLAYFNNLCYLEIRGDNFSGIEVLKNLSQLKTLAINGEISNSQLKAISESNYIESLAVYFQNMDYSVLSDMNRLKTIRLTKPLRASSLPDDFEPLLTLPSENCQIDLGFISNEYLTPDLYEVLSTHSNISKIGKLLNRSHSDISFLEDMKYLTALDIATHDITSISKMTWLTQLAVGGDFDPSQLSELSNLQSLKLSTGKEQVITLEFLVNMDQLHNLELWGCTVFNLDGIEVSRELKSLICVSGLNELSDITPLRNCIDLEFLCLDGNFITDIRPLSNLSKLEELQIQVDSDIVERIDITLWRKTLLSLPNLKFYSGGVYDGEWISEYFPNVKHGRSNMQGRGF